MSKKRVLSGIRTSGDIHLGIYIGAMTQWLERQADDNYENWFFVADLHGITTPFEPEKLHELTWKSIMLYMAVGLDIEKSTLFVQSHIPAHAELTWLLNCTTPFTWAKNMIQWKEKGDDIGEDATIGLFDYPVLMAADILLYDTDLVPVGEDQSQHVEVARDIAKRFNRLYGETFVEPEVLLLKEGKRIAGLDNPEKKMSKSAESKYNYINLLDTPDDVRLKISKAVTDAGEGIVFDPERKAVHNLLTIYQFLTKEDNAVIEERFAGKGYADFKADLAERMVEFLKPIQEKYAELDKNRDHVRQVLAEGAKKAEAVASQKLEQAKKNMGLLMP